MLKKLIVKSLSVLIATTLACLPLYVVRCSSFSWCSSPIPFTLLEVLILATAVSWTLNKLVKDKGVNFRTSLQKIEPSLRALFLVFLVAGLFGVVASSDRVAALGAFRAYFVEPILFAFICFDVVREKEGNSKIIFWSLALAAIWLAGLAFFEQIFHFSLANQREFMLRERVSGVYITSNALSLFLAPILFLLLGKVYDLTRNKSQTNNLDLIYLLTIGIFASTVGILLSGSRGGIFGVFSGVLLFLVLKYVVEKNEVKLLSIFQRIIKFIVPVLVISSILFLFNIRFIIEINNKYSLFPEINSRLCLWDGTSNLITNNPVFGTGLSGFQDSYKDFRTCSKEIINYPHNILFNFWTETGLLGLISFLVVVFLICYRLLRLPKVSLTAIGVICAFAVTFVHGLVDVPYFKNDLSVLFWIIVALALIEVDYQAFTVKHRTLQPSPRRKY